MPSTPTPTDRELEILQVLWQREEATVREIYEELRRRNLPIVQNTVQAFLRTMEEKGLVGHRVDGRTFIYKPLVQRERTKRRLVQRLMQRAFDGAVDQLVQSAFSVRKPTAKELETLEEMLADLKRQASSSKSKESSS